MSTYPQFTKEQLYRLPQVLSAPRFATYLRSCSGDRVSALTLYRWNLEVSAAFLVPLHVLEVSLRNAIVDGIEAVHSGTWPWSEGFLRSLPNPPAPSYSPTRDLRRLSQLHRASGKITADLKFVFWEKMLTARHQDRLWSRCFYTVFPNAPTEAGSAQARAALRADVGEIRKLRNRIAHHEPIFTRDLHADRQRMIDIVRWRCDTTADWLVRIDPVSALLRRKPQQDAH